MTCSSYEVIKYAPDTTPSTVTNTEYESTLSHMSPIDFNTNPGQSTENSDFCNLDLTQNQPIRKAKSANNFEKIPY